MRAIPKSTSEWLVKKKSKIEKKILLYTKHTYIPALLFHIVATQIQALVIPSHQVLYCIVLYCILFVQEIHIWRYSLQI
jgi:hypothetical protein